MYAPKKPIAIENKHPPPAYPASDWPIAPATPATTSNTIKSTSVILFTKPPDDHPKGEG